MAAAGQVDLSCYPSFPVPEVWTAEAACRRRWHLFWPPNGHPPEHGSAKAAREAKARALCHSCPVLADCLAWVLDGDTDPVPGTICAGLDEGERRAIREANTTLQPRLWL